MTKAIIFDFDGTLADTLSLCIEAFRRATEPITGRPLTDAQTVAHFGPSEEGTFRTFVPEAYRKATEDYLFWYERLHDRWPAPFEGIPELLARLRGRGVRLALVTGKSPRCCAISLRKYGLEEYFPLTESVAPDSASKAPNIRRVLQRFGIRGDEALYVGDTAGDVLNAREAGVETLSVLWGSVTDRPAVEAARPRALFERVEELERYLFESVLRPEPAEKAEDGQKFGI